MKRVVIFILAFALVGCAGRANKSESSNSSTVNEQEVVADATDKNEQNDVPLKVHPELLGSLDVAAYKQYGITGIECGPEGIFVVNSHELIKVAEGEDTDVGLNFLRFYNWEEPMWYKNNYIRAIRLYMDALSIGAIENGELAKYKDLFSGKFVLINIDDFMAGGAFVHFAFVENPKVVFDCWVYSFVEEEPLRVSGYEVRQIGISDENASITKELIAKELQINPYQQLW